jgi:hypothetical protein
MSKYLISTDINKLIKAVDFLIDQIPDNFKDEFNNPKETLLQASHFLNIAFKESFNLE